MKRAMFYSTIVLLSIAGYAIATEIQVYAVSNPWTDTGVFLPAGGYIDISASGSWCGNVNGNPPIWYGPEGTGNPAPSVFLVPGTYSGVLVGRIDSGSGFTVGLGGRLDASAYGVGEIWLAFNDQIGAYGDNAGFVNVSLTPEPATLLLLGLGGLALLRRRRKL